MSNCKSNASGVYTSYKWPKLWQWCLIVGLWGLWLPSPAWAVQIHGAPEGLYVHLTAHLVFSVALVFLLCKLDRYPPGVSSGWRFLKLSLVFFLLWNIDTFAVHLLSLELPDEAFLTKGPLWFHRLLGPMTIERWAYYLGRFDHLFCLPAMWFLTRSIREFCRETDQRLDQPERAQV